jgi:hypothetical protein
MSRLDFSKDFERPFIAGTIALLFFISGLIIKGDMDLIILYFVVLIWIEVTLKK